MSKWILFLIVAMMGAKAIAGSNSIDLNCEMCDVLKVLKDYSKARGQKITIDPSARGKVTLLNPSPVSLDEAFDQISRALALNRLSIIDDENGLVVLPTRAAQRSNIPVFKEQPPVKPERMVTWVVTLKHISADDLMRSVRMMNSKDGEMSTSGTTNQLVISDYTSSLTRIGKIIAELDQPLDPARAKIVEADQKTRAQVSETKRLHK